MTISPESVKELRTKTGAGMMDCKRALAEAQGDMHKAVEVLRKQGLALAAKRSGRAAAEGLIGNWLASDRNSGALVEINCETDFVAKNDLFQSFVSEVTRLIAKDRPTTRDALLNLKTGNQTLKELVTEQVAKIGENIGIRRVSLLTTKNGQSLAQYLHAGNKIGVMVLFSDPATKLPESTAREVAMHVAAMNPQYAHRSNIPADVLEKEKEIQRAQLATQKKPPEILEKIVTGKLEKFYSDVCLEEQLYVRDPEGKRTVAKFLQAIDPGIRVETFVRYQVGEGIEKA